MGGPKRGRRGGQRPERVGEQIRQVLSDLLMSGAFKEPRLGAADIVSFTEVRVTGDLRGARVFTSVFPSEPEVVSEVMAGLEAATPRVRALLAREVRLRHTPELRFSHDASIEQGAAMERLIAEVRAEDRALAAARGEGEDAGPPDAPPASPGEGARPSPEPED